MVFGCADAGAACRSGRLKFLDFLHQVKFVLPCEIGNRRTGRNAVRAVASRTAFYGGDFLTLGGDSWGRRWYCALCGGRRYRNSARLPGEAPHDSKAFLDQITVPAEGPALEANFVGRNQGGRSARFDFTEPFDLEFPKRDIGCLISAEFFADVFGCRLMIEIVPPGNVGKRRTGGLGVSR